MGSTSSSIPWVIAAIISGLLYFLFDSARHFANQLGPVALRRWSGDSQQDRFSWMRYDPRHFQMVSGAILQVCLVGAVACTAVAFEPRGATQAALLALVIWSAAVIAFKFVLALVPDDFSEPLLRAIVPVSQAFYFVFWPFLFPLGLLLERVGREDHDDDGDDEEVTDEEIQAYIDVGEEEGILESGEGRLLQSIVDFGDALARELMTPRIDVLAFDVNQPFELLARLFSESKYSRIPVYEGSIDTIIGVVHIKDIYDAVLRRETILVRDVARPAMFVPETKKVSELLKEFQTGHVQIAVVLDEFGGTAGLITIEDVVEEIVGDISDEHEDEESSIVKIGDDIWMVSGLVKIDILEEMLDAEFEGDDYETVAGLIFTTLGHVPRVAESIEKSGVLFEVDRADRKRIYRVRVSRLPAAREDSDEGP
jgi:CBS domain containing-hemolysin-like protein